MIRLNVNMLLDDLQQAAGSCEIAAKGAAERGEGELSLFLSGAAASLDLIANCRKPEDFGTMVAAEFGLGNGVIS